MTLLPNLLFSPPSFSSRSEWRLDQASPQSNNVSRQTPSFSARGLIFPHRRRNHSRSSPIWPPAVSTTPRAAIPAPPAQKVSPTAGVFTEAPDHPSSAILLPSSAILEYPSPGISVYRTVSVGRRRARWIEKPLRTRSLFSRSLPLLLSSDFGALVLGSRSSQSAYSVASD